MTTIVTILSDRYADWECALTMAAGRTYYGLNVVTASQGGASVTSAGGLRIIPDMAIENIDPDRFDLLLIPGGSVWESEEVPEIGPLLTRTAARGKTIAAICGATRALAGAGLLNAVPHTSNGPDYLRDVKGYKGAGHYRDVPHAIAAGQLITAPGTAPVSFMKQIMATLGKGGPELDWYIGQHAAEHRPAA